MSLLKQVKWPLLRNKNQYLKVEHRGTECKNKIFLTKKT